MLGRLTNYIGTKIVAIKSMCANNKKLILFVSGLVLIAFVNAICLSYDNEQKSVNFIIVAVGNNLNPFGFLLRSALFVFLFYLLILISSCHFVACLVSFGGFYLLMFYTFRAGFIAVAVDGALGFLFLIIYIIPCIVIYTVTFAFLIAYVYDLCGYAYNKKHLVNFSFYSKNVLSKIGKYAAFTFGTQTVWYLLIFYLTALIS